MKVVCINKNGWEIMRRFLFWKWTIDAGGPAYDEVCEVIGTIIDDGELCYFLKGYPQDDWFDAVEFEPFVELSETTSESLLNPKPEEVAT